MYFVRRLESVVPMTVCIFYRVLQKAGLTKCSEGKMSLGQVHLENATQSLPLLETDNLHPQVKGSEKSSVGGALIFV